MGKLTPPQWIGKLKAVSLERGLELFQADPYMFISDKAICIIYVDDVLWAAKK